MSREYIEITYWIVYYIKVDKELKTTNLILIKQIKPIILCNIDFKLDQMLNGPRRNEAESRSRTTRTMQTFEIN